MKTKSENNKKYEELHELIDDIVSVHTSLGIDTLTLRTLDVADRRAYSLGRVETANRLAKARHLLASFHDEIRGVLEELSKEQRELFEACRKEQRDGEALTTLFHSAYPNVMFVDGNTGNPIKVVLEEREEKLPQRQRNKNTKQTTA